MQVMPLLEYLLQNSKCIKSVSSAQTKMIIRIAKKCFFHPNPSSSGTKIQTQTLSRKMKHISFPVKYVEPFRFIGMRFLWRLGT